MTPTTNRSLDNTKQNPFARETNSSIPLISNSLLQHDILSVAIDSNTCPLLSIHGFTTISNTTTNTMDDNLSIKTRELAKWNFSGMITLTESDNDKSL